MKSAFMQIPAPLQRQALIMLGIGVLFLLTLIVLLLFTPDVYILLPCAGASVFCIMTAFSLVRRSILGEYIVISGVCWDIGFTRVKRRARYIMLHTGEHVIQVMLHGRNRNVSENADIDVYIAKNSPLYERDGVQILYNYLAIDIKQKYCRV